MARRFWAFSSLWLALTSSLFANQSDLGDVGSVTLTQFNLRWFGAADVRARPNDEERLGAIRAYLKSAGRMADIMVFEEIVDVALLKSSVLEDKYGCQSYSKPDPNHQHVVLCVRAGLKLEMAPGEKNFIIEQVDVTGRLRPAVHGIVRSESGRTIAHVFAVHLKAEPQQSAVRMRQMNVLADYISQRPTDAPVVILGDFNTYGKDAQNFEDLLSSEGIREVESPEAYSWNSGSEKYPPAKFDRAFVANELADRVISQNVIGPCTGGTRAEVLEYNRKISDHCAVKTVIGLD